MDGRCGRGPARRTASAAQYGAGEVDIDVSPACRSGPDRRSGPYPRLDPRAAGSGHLRGARDAAWTDGLGDHRPERDRPSGGAWRGLETMCHVSALLASAHAPEPGSAQQLLEAADGTAASRGLRRRSEREENGVRATTWSSDRGDLLEVIVGVRVAIRAISAPFLPGSL